jgi:hypothetical protein
MSMPRDVRIGLPPGWYGIDLDPESTDASVRWLLDRQFRGRDDLPHVKAVLRDALLEAAARARDVGGMQLWLSVDPIGELLLPASLLVSAVPPYADLVGDEPDALAELQRLRTELGHEAEVVSLELGRALRVRRVELENSPDPLAQPGDAATTLVVVRSTVLEFVVPIPEDDGHLLLSFSTPSPVPELTEAFIELFDVMAATARWIA